MRAISLCTFLWITLVMAAEAFDLIPTPKERIPTPRNNSLVTAPNMPPVKPAPCPCPGCKCPPGSCPECCDKQSKATSVASAGQMYKGMAGTQLHDDGSVSIYDPRDGGTYRFSKEGRESGYYSDDLIRQIAERVRASATSSYTSAPTYQREGILRWSQSAGGCANGQCGR